MPPEARRVDKGAGRRSYWWRGADGVGCTGRLIGSATGDRTATSGQTPYTSAVSALSKDPRLSSAPLSILIASGTFHPDAGGPPTYLLTLGQELVERGHRVRVVTYGDEPRVRRRYPYPVTRVPRALAVPRRLGLFAREVYRQGRDADVLYVNDYGLPAMLANLLLRKPLVMKVVGDFAWEWSVRHGLVPADESIDRFQTRRYRPKVEGVRSMQATYARRADAIVVPSPYVRDYVAGWGVDPSRIRVVYNAVSDPTAGLGEDRPAVRAALGLDRDADVVLAVARLTAWKGVDTLIRALPALRERRPKAILAVVGDGPDRARLEGLAAEAPAGSVHFAGELAHREVARYLVAADALALCSGYEGLSHVLLEAMAAGVPVVASNVGGNRALVRHGENGLLVPFGDVPATAAALARLLDDRPLAARLAGAARAETSARTTELMVDETVAVLRSVIEVRA